MFFGGCSCHAAKGDRIRLGPSPSRFPLESRYPPAHHDPASPPPRVHLEGGGGGARLVLCKQVACPSRLVPWVLGWDTTPRLELLHTKGQLLLTLAFLSGRYSLDRFRLLLPLLSQRVLAAQFDSRTHFSVSSTCILTITANQAVLPNLVQVHSSPG